MVKLHSDGFQLLGVDHLVGGAPPCHGFLGFFSSQEMENVRFKSVVQWSIHACNRWTWHVKHTFPSRTHWGYWVWVILIMMLTCCCWQFRSALSKHWHLLTFARMHYHLCKVKTGGRDKMCGFICGICLKIWGSKVEKSTNTHDFT